MTLLALDTATDQPVVVLCDAAGAVRAGGTVDGRAQGILALIDELTSRAGVAPAEITAIVVGTGPGTFTGLRVGVATARGLAETLGVPLHGVTSLRVAAASSPMAGLVTLAAGRGECFVQATDVPDAPVEVLPAADCPAPTPITPEGLAAAAAERRAAAISAGEDGDPAAVVPGYGRAPDAVPPRIDVALGVLDARDLDALVALDERCFTTPWTRGMYAAELDRPAGDAVRLAARDASANDRLVGAALAARIGSAWHVMNVFVDPAARGRGIARQLLGELFERTRILGVGEGWTLEVRDGNEAAIGLYESCGFAHAGRRPGYYRDGGEDALVMWRYATADDHAAVQA